VLVADELVTTVVVEASLTVWLTPTGVLLLLKFPSPENNAVIVRVPTGKLLKFSVACPFTSVCVPSVVTPSRNRTVPVGVPLPLPAALTVTVNVAVSPNTVTPFPWFTEMLDVDLLTTCDTTLDVLAAYAGVPLYTAVIVCVARLSDPMVNCACPLPSSVTGPPSAVAPS
jgi:hypothetical protein